MGKMLSLITGIIAVLAVSGCDEGAFMDITGEVDTNYFHGTQKLLASDGAGSDEFGHYVAVSADGSTVVASSPVDDGSRGSAYVYRWNGQSWVEIKLIASDGAASDGFGRSVALSADGNTVVVGEPYVDTPAANGGAAYVFRWNGSAYIQAQKVQPSTLFDDSYFGTSVAVSGDGSRIAVGAMYLNFSGGSPWGAVYIFRKNGSTYELLGNALNALTTQNYDSFCRVALSADGSTLAVGSQGYDSYKGAVFVFQWNGSNYSNGQRLAAVNPTNSEELGNCISISADGSTVVAGAFRYNSSRGAVYVFRRNGSSYTQVNKLIASDGINGDGFGISVAVSGDGGRVTTGAYNDDETFTDQGSAYLYRWNGTEYVLSKKILADDVAANNYYYGSGIALSADDSMLVVGAFGYSSSRGTVWLYAD